VATKKQGQASASVGVSVALIYTRVSSDEQRREGLSLGTQLVACRRYAAERGWLVGGEYQDVLSGKRDDRPRYQELLTEVRRLRAEGRRVVVIVAWLHRFGRRVLERVRCREELKELGVATHSVREGGEVSDLIANILASVAEEEVRQLGERVSAVIEHLEANGWHKGGRPAWGYRWRPAAEDERRQGAPKMVLESDEVTAPYVREAFRRVAEDGASVRAITCWLASLPEEARGGRVLNLRAVAILLRAPVYISRHYAGESDVAVGISAVLARPVCRWPATIDEATWSRVQQRIDGHTKMPRQASGRHLLTGLLRCPHCGHRMVGKRPMGRSLARYTCISTLLGKTGVSDSQRCTFSCTATHLEEAVLDAAGGAINGIVTASSQPHMRAQLSRVWETLRRPAGGASTVQRVRTLEAQSERLRQRIVRATELLADGEITKAAYDDLCEKAQSDHDASERELTSLRGVTTEPRLPSLEQVLSAAGVWDRVLRESDRPTQRQILGEFIEHVCPRRIKQGQYGAEIAWTPVGEALRNLNVTFAADERRQSGKPLCA